MTLSFPTLFSPTRRSPRLALALPLLLAALSAGGHYLGQWLEARGLGLQRIATARARAGVLDLAGALDPGARARLVAALHKEIQVASNPAMTGPPLTLALERCRDAEQVGCAAALRGLESWALAAAQTVRINRGLRIGLLVLLALAACVLGWLAVRHTHGRLAGLCLLGAALVFAGAGWRGNELARHAGQHQRVAALDLLVVRGRVLTGLPQSARGKRLAALVEQVAQQPAVAASRAGRLRAAARACGARQLACGRFLVALGRIHADNRDTAPAGRIRRWIDRWLLGSGIIALLLVALVAAARRGGAAKTTKA